MLNTISKAGLWGLDKAIALYQFLLSPDHSWLKSLWPHGVCRYEPTCSVYMRQAIAYHGWFGVRLGLQRLSHCHPWAKGGYDPVKTL